MSSGNNAIRIQKLYIYPIKSCGAVELNEMKVGLRGPDFDRQWMLVDEKNQFITQRQFPELARIKLKLESSQLKIQIKNSFFDIFLGDAANSSESVSVKVWKDEVQASIEDQKINQAFSDFLNQPIRLVQFRDFSQRPVPSAVKGFDTHVRFADSRPILLTNTKSLELFNSWLESPVSMSRFRPNVIVETQEAFEEDHWSRWENESLRFSQPKLCSRCVMINVDQESGEVPSPLPLKTLATHRLIQGKAIFGVHFTPEGSGVLRVGNQLELAP